MKTPKGRAIAFVAAAGLAVMQQSVTFSNAELEVLAQLAR